MTSTVNTLLENTMHFNTNTVLENGTVFRQAIEPITEDVKQLLGYTLEKVNIVKDRKTDKCYVEYSNNLERYMKDQVVTLNEAIQNISERYAIFESDIVIVVDESCVDKIDMKALIEQYNVVKN